MNTLKSGRLSLFIIPILIACGYGIGNNARAQDGSGKATMPTTQPATKDKTKQKAVKPVATTNKPSNSKKKKQPDPPVADWEINNMPGHWEGKFNGENTTLEIQRFEGDTFYGFFTTGKYQIAFTGVVERTTRKVTITETQVLHQNGDGEWTLGVLIGTLPYDGLNMQGTKKEGNAIYKWSFYKIIEG
ncbi:MAG TPA: hypothetical protein VGC76_07095 [Pyrinomonadaceae bacterium]|jgi:hypothetical protein